MLYWYFTLPFIILTWNYYHINWLLPFNHVQDSSEYPPKGPITTKEMKIIIALGAACITAMALKDSEREQLRLKSLLNDYVLHRLSALEEKVQGFFYLHYFIQKILFWRIHTHTLSHTLTHANYQMKLLADVDRMIDLEKERLEVDRRDSQIQRAQLALQVLGQIGPN